MIWYIPFFALDLFNLIRRVQNTVEYQALQFKLCKLARHMHLYMLKMINFYDCFFMFRHLLSKYQLNIINTMCARCTDLEGNPTTQTETICIPYDKEWLAVPMNEWISCFNTCHMQFCVCLLAIKTCGCVIIADY